MTSCWYKVQDTILKHVRLDPCLVEKRPVDYYTAVYSDAIPKFKEHFDQLRGSREDYFTPTDRALLTYELLSRATSKDHPQGNSNKIIVRIGLLNRSFRTSSFEIQWVL